MNRAERLDARERVLLAFERGQLPIHLAERHLEEIDGPALRPVDPPERPRHHVTPEVRARIVALRAQGLTQHAIARRVGFSQHTVHNVLKLIPHD